MAVPILVNGTSGVLAAPIYVRGDQCRLVGAVIGNPAVAASYINFYDSAVTPTVGTTVPTLQVFINTLVTTPIDLSADSWVFFKGLWVAAATTASGSTAPATAQVISLAVD